MAQLKTAPPAAVKLQDVAAAADVSVSTAWMAISNHPAINPDTRARVLAASRSMRYRPLRRTKRANAKPAPAPAVKRVGFALLDANPRNARASYEQLKMVSTLAQDAGLRLEVTVLTVDEADAPQRIEQLAAGVDALLLYGYVDVALLRRLSAYKIPRVFLGNIMGDAENPTPQEPAGWHVVTSDPTRMGHDATALLMRAGHRRIGSVGGRAVPGMWSDCWRRGYQYAHADAGIPVDPALMQITEAAGSAAHFAGMKSAPTAYVISDSTLAEEFLSEMASRGKPVAKNTIVIGANPASLAITNMQGVPAMVQSIPPLIKASIGLIQQLLEGREFPCARIVLPFESRNVDAIACR